MNELLTQINRARAQARMCGGVAMPASVAVTWDVRLASAADRHSRDMADTRKVDHMGSDGRTFIDRVFDAGYPGWSLAETIAAGSSTATGTVGQWLASAPHCQILMSAQYTQVGGSCAVNSASGYRYYWTLNLGHP